MTVLIPNQDQSVGINYRHGNNGKDHFRVGYVGQINVIKPEEEQIFIMAMEISVL